MIIVIIFAVVSHKITSVAVIHQHRHRRDDRRDDDEQYPPEVSLKKIFDDISVEVLKKFFHRRCPFDMTFQIGSS